MKTLCSLAAPVWIAAIGVVSCHAQASNGDTVNGVIGGVPFTARDAYAVETTSVTSGVPTATVIVAVTNFADACAMGAAARAGGTTIEISITREGGPVLAGVYGADAGGDERVTAVLQRTADASCQLSDLESASSGSITLDSVTTTDVIGSFALTFPGGSLSGAFHAPLCGADDAATGDDAGPPVAVGSDASLPVGCGP